VDRSRESLLPCQSEVLEELRVSNGASKSSESRRCNRKEECRVEVGRNGTTSRSGRGRNKSERRTRKQIINLISTEQLALQSLATCRITSSRR
jgi:hypothetical protein